MTKTRRILAQAALLALAVGVGACSPKGAQPDGAGAASSAPPSASASSSGAASQSGSAAQSGMKGEGNQAPDVNVTDDGLRCDVANFQPAVGSVQEAGGTSYVDLVFTNNGPACWISGFPQIVFSAGGTTMSSAVHDGEDPGNVYTVARGGRVGVTLTAEALDGIEGCTPGEADLIDITAEGGGGSASLQLSLRVCREISSVAVSSFEPRP